MSEIIEAPLEDPKIPVDNIDVSDLLSQYSAPMQEETPEPEMDAYIESPPGMAGELAHEWKGDTRYYQRGQKAGQLRPNAIPRKEMTLGGDILDGAMFITLVDTLVPMIIALANNSFSKIKVDPDKMTLTDKQKKQLEPICEQVVKKLSLTADPTWLLIVALFSMYGIQFYSIRQEAKQDYDNRPKA